jgi:pimeloyl-ACP methyl ester carboxylesterase
MDTQIVSNYLTIRQTKIHYLEAKSSSTNAVLFLHGASFKAQTWLDLGTLAWLANKGYRTVAVDLPGYGESDAMSGNRENLLLELLESLSLVKPVIVSPSMSGRYSLPLVVNHSDKLTGFVAVAPVGIVSFEAQLPTVAVPTLAIWGSNDSIVPVAQADRLCQQMPDAELIILKNAGHACYMRATDEFHRHLLKFVERCYQK